MATPPPLPGGLPTNNGYPYDLTYKFNASMAIIVVVLVTTFFFMALFVLYIRRCNMITSAGWGASPTEQQQQQQQQQRSNQQQGLDREALDKLPIMRYSSIKSMKRGKAGPECAVCLLLFEESEKVRVLPDCGHLFHSECIDMWLETHSTCPLCRRSLDPKSVAGSNGLQRALSAVLSSFRREPGVDHEAAEVEADQLPARDLQEPAAAAAVVSRRHDQAGEVVRTLSMHSESFRNAVHDMDLLQVREKLRARSIRVNTTDPGPDTRINVFHHSKSFGGLHHFEEEQDHHDHHDQDHDHQSQEHKDDQNALRRSVSDGESLFRAQDRSNSSSSSHMFSGFASKSKRSLKWLVGSGNSSSAAAAKDDQLV